MFATTILPCRTGCLNDERDSYLTKIGLGCIGDITYTNQSRLDVSTVGAEFSLLPSTKFNASDNAYELRPFPGQENRVTAYTSR